MIKGEVSRRVSEWVISQNLFFLQKINRLGNYINFIGFLKVNTFLAYSTRIRDEEKRQNQGTTLKRVREIKC